MKTFTNSNKRIKIPGSYFLIFAMTFFVLSQGLLAQTVSPWLTRGDQSARLQQQNTISFGNGNASNATISIDENTLSQRIAGFGFALTQGSAQALSSLDQGLQNSVLNELFDPASGNAVSIVRISIAASDLSNSTYTYNETNGDVAMNNFSLDGPDRSYLLPILKKILAINPNIKILATPWTAPTWMKDNNSYIGGRLEGRYYEAYARYFVKYLQAMRAEGISVWAITPQNEPENPFNEPSMLMNSSEQKDFINNHLGPQLRDASFSTKIIAFDHNCDNPAYPIDVLNNSSFVDGAAFHLYAGDISTMGNVRNQTGKNVYFTEQFTSSNGQFDGDFGWHMENVVIGSLRNWSRSVVEWNLATFGDYGPRTPGGCTTCLGAITVNNSGSITRNVSYYIIGQISKFVAPGAQRLGSGEGIPNTAFKNPDGSRALLVYNSDGRSRGISVNWNGKNFSYTVPARSAVTFTWSVNGNSPTAPPAPTGLSATAGDAQVSLAWDASSGASVYEVRRSSGNNATFTTLDGNVNGTTFTDTGLNNGTRYFYRVRAKNGVGISGDSNEAGAVPKGAPDPEPNGGIVSGGVYRITSKQTGKVVDVSGVSQNNGARVQQWEWANGDNQKWVVDAVGNGEYRLTALHSGKALDVVDGSTEDRAEIQQWDYFANNNQKWRIVAKGDGSYGIISVKSNKALDVPNGNPENGVKLIQFSQNSLDLQRWYFELLSGNTAATLGLNTIDQEIGITEMAFPNPTDGSSFTVQFMARSLAPVDLHIYSMSGRSVGTINYDPKNVGRQQVNLTNWVRGLAVGRYFVKIDDKKILSFIKK